LPYVFPVNPVIQCLEPESWFLLGLLAELLS
jgi:hypothetical protein